MCFPQYHVGLELFQIGLQANVHSICLELPGDSGAVLSRVSWWMHFVRTSCNTHIRIVSGT